MKKFVHAALCAAVFLTLCSCERTQTTHKGGYEDVSVYFGLGYNDLSPNILEDFMEIQEGILPGKERDEAFLAYVHTTKTYGDYETDTPAYLIQVYRVHAAGQYLQRAVSVHQKGAAVFSADEGSDRGRHAGA